MRSQVFLPLSLTEGSPLGEEKATQSSLQADRRSPDMTTVSNEAYRSLPVPNYGEEET